MERPYIGITGITTRTEALQVADAFHDCSLEAPNTRYDGMAGFLVSLSSLNNRGHSQPKFANVGNLPELFAAIDQKALNSVHYHSPEPSTIHYQLSNWFKFLKAKEALPQILQLNTAWPSTDEIQKLRSDYPDLKIVIQIRRRNLDAGTIKQYAGMVDYVLLDQSGGRGRTLNPTDFAQTYQTVRTELPDATIIFAGGLSATNVNDKIEAIRQVTGPEKFGLDAETELRTTFHQKTKLDTGKVKGYVHQACMALKRMD